MSAEVGWLQKELLPLSRAADGIHTAEEEASKRGEAWVRILRAEDNSAAVGIAFVGESSSLKNTEWSRCVTVGKWNLVKGWLPSGVEFHEFLQEAGLENVSSGACIASITNGGGYSNKFLAPVEVMHLSAGAAVGSITSYLRDEGHNVYPHDPSAGDGMLFVRNVLGDCLILGGGFFLTFHIETKLGRIANEPYSIHTGFIVNQLGLVYLIHSRESSDRKTTVPYLHFGQNQSGIVFANFAESIAAVDPGLQPQIVGEGTVSSGRGLKVK